MRIGNKEITLKCYGATSCIWYIIPTICFSREVFYFEKKETTYIIEILFFKMFCLLRLKIQKPYDTQDF